VQIDSIPMSTSRSGKQRVKDVEIVATQRPWRGAYDDENTFRVKQEEGSPVPITSVSAPSDFVAEIQPVEPDEPNKPLSKKRGTRLPTFQTEEEKKEWDRHNDDLKTIVDELGVVSLEPPPSNEGATDTTKDNPVDKKEDRVYLFQFPPVVPDLFDENKMDVDLLANAQRDDKQALASEPNTEEIVTVKDDSDPKKKEAESNRLDHLPNLGVGKVGKLRVYKSGKATLDWGGTSLQLNMGVNPFFLQDSVMVKMDKQTDPSTTSTSSAAPAPPRQSANSAGEAMAFGQIRGKFIVTPDWDEVLGKF